MEVLVININDEITAKEVRLVGDTYNGVFNIQNAMRIAEEEGLDLVQFSEDKIPVCKLLDYQKFMYQKRKSVKPQKQIKTKEVRMDYGIDHEGIKLKAKTAQRLLKEGNRCKLSLIFKGRTMAFIGSGEAIIEEALGLIDGYERLSGISKSGNICSISIGPAKA